MALILTQTVVSLPELILEKVKDIYRQAADFSTGIFRK